MKLVLIAPIIIYVYLFLQITKIATIDYFEISNVLKALGYQKETYVLLLALRVVDEILKILLSGPLKIFIIIEMLSSIPEYHETIAALRDMRQRIG